MPDYTKLSFWTEYLTSRGFNSPYYGTISWPITSYDSYDSYLAHREGYIYKKDKYKILAKLNEYFPSIFIQCEGVTLNTDVVFHSIYTLSSKRFSMYKAPERQFITEIFQLINAIADPTGAQFLLCVQYEWARPLVERVLKGGPFWAERKEYV
jgi:hypothetical protein